jgi:hypothetical protein
MQQCGAEKSNRSLAMAADATISAHVEIHNSGVDIFNAETASWTRSAVS